MVNCRAALLQGALKFNVMLKMCRIACRFSVKNDLASFNGKNDKIIFDIKILGVCLLLVTM